MQNTRSTIYVVSMFDDYVLEQISDHFYQPRPQQRDKGGVYVTPVFNGQLIETDKAPHWLIDKVTPHAQKFYGELDQPITDANILVYYQIMSIGGKKFQRDFLRRAVHVMETKVLFDGVLDDEDDHNDFFQSALEALVQIALEWDLMQELKPLHDVIVKHHVETCSQAYPDTECWLPSIIKNHL